MLPNRTNRREFASFTTASTLAAAVSLSQGQRGLAQEPGLNRFPRMMQEYMVGKVQRAHRQSVRAKQSLETREDAEAYVQDVRQKIAACFGSKPERTPLNARVTGVVDRERYTIENVIFESRPNFPVTANLYLPKMQAKVPGVVGTCGHSTNGKAAEAYQSFSQGLALQGYACLIYDPIGQGERFQYPSEAQKKKIRAGVGEHIQAGNQQFLVGENLSMWRAWDGIRALDYLLERPEIDPTHLGVTGNSGGGTMTTWLCGVEDRWTMAAPACFVTTFLHNMENELPADTEQCPPGVLAMGLEHEDFLAAMAPKPIVILAKERDFFDVRGSEEAFQRLKRLYKLLGKPENIALHVGPTDHGYSIENREAMYRWFNKATKVSDAQSEPKLTIESDETLWCTKSGQVDELKPATVFSFTREKAEQLQLSRGKVKGPVLVDRIQENLKISEKLPRRSPNFRILRSSGRRDYPLPQATIYAVETEPGVFSVCYALGNERHQARPRRLGPHALLYVSHRSSDDELRTNEWLRGLIRQDESRSTFTCDVRGIGESLPNTCGIDTFDNPYGCDYFYAIHSLMLDRPYLGQKTYDVLRTLQWLGQNGYEQVELAASGWGTLSATFAALLSDQVKHVYLQNALSSFHSLATDEMYSMPLANLLPGVLEHFDLPDCYAQLGPRLTTV